MGSFQKKYLWYYFPRSRRLQCKLDFFIYSDIVSDKVLSHFTGIENFYNEDYNNNFSKIINQKHLNDFSLFITNLKLEIKSFIENKKHVEIIYNTD